MMATGYELPVSAARGDWKTLRAAAEAGLAATEAALPERSRPRFPAASLKPGR
jgi:hypothetical protein